MQDKLNEHKFAGNDWILLLDWMSLLLTIITRFVGNYFFIYI